MMVKVISIDKTGKIRLSRKEALAERAGQQAAAAPSRGSLLRRRRPPPRRSGGPCSTGTQSSSPWA